MHFESMTRCKRPKRMTERVRKEGKQINRLKELTGKYKLLTTTDGKKPYSDQFTSLKDLKKSVV